MHVVLALFMFSLQIQPSAHICTMTLSRYELHKALFTRRRFLGVILMTTVVILVIAFQNSGEFSEGHGEYNKRL